MSYSNNFYTDEPQSYGVRTATAIARDDVASEHCYEISDAQWAQIAPLLTLGSKLGRPYADTRRTLNGILYVTKSNCGWRNMPKYYGSYVTCWRRLTRWQAKGIWKQVEEILAVSERSARQT